MAMMRLQGSILGMALFCVLGIRVCEEVERERREKNKKNLSGGDTCNEGKVTSLLF
jgi:hypothetical protein